MTDLLFADAIRDKPTVTSEGQILHKLPEGVRLRDAITHVDDRGTVCEMFDPRWGWHDEPIVFTYMFTLRPGMVKGWGMHLEHEDRYFIMFGDMEVVMYDARPDSPTHRMVAKVVMSELRRQLLCIPTGVWHANHNIGHKDAVVVNFPTRPYDHENHDKHRLPIDTDLIPYKFENARGW
jgi:dTDP-4-dehydrorhamnose 3,5-epimerase